MLNCVSGYSSSIFIVYEMKFELHFLIPLKKFYIRAVITGDEFDEGRNRYWEH